MTKRAGGARITPCHALAKAGLADLYRDGEGMPRDTARAIELYTEAAAGTSKVVAEHAAAQLRAMGVAVRS